MRLGPFVVLVGATLGCRAPELDTEPGKLVSDIVPGLQVRGAASLTPDDHLVELLVHAGHVYVANSNYGVGVLRLDDDGGLTPTYVSPELELRCTSLAVHPLSNTLYCAGDGERPMEPRLPAIEILDVSTPAQPLWRDLLELERWAVRDIEVVGDTLLIHQFSDGLWTADITPDGNLSNLQQLPIDGNARTSVVVGERVITAFADPQGRGTLLRLFEIESWTELASLALDGPPMGISADADGASRVAVGLGSGGMALVEVGPDTLTLERTVSPPAVVTHGLVAGELAVAITLSGAFAWSLEGDQPRLFGFAPEGSQGEKRNGNMLHGLLHDGELLTSDWTWVERWAIEPQGEVVALDVPRGFLVAPGHPVRWQLRNPGSLPLRAEFWLAREHVFDVEIEGNAIVEVELPAELRARLGPAEPRLTLGIRVHDPLVSSDGQPLSTSSFVVLQRDADDPLPPAVGDTFPTATFADRELQPFTLPLTGGTHAIWFTIDCALMWPEVEDLAWLDRSGRALGLGQTVLLVDTNIALDGFEQRWAVQNLALGLWGLAAPPEVSAANGEFDEELYRSFFEPSLPGDAVILDTVIAADGEILSIERMYRGPWSLAAR